MSDLDYFIKDVIYGLKIEYGTNMLIGRWNGTMNPRTGMKDFDRIVTKLAKAIPLPVTMRQQFLKSLGVLKAGNLEFGDREILIDTDDLDVTPVPGDFTVYKNFFGDIKSVENYGQAIILIVREIKNKPIIQDEIVEQEILSLMEVQINTKN